MPQALSGARTVEMVIPAGQFKTTATGMRVHPAPP